MDTTSETPRHIYDTIVIGAGPAGCEAALSAARGGAGSVLCLAINLDTVGFPPANPVIADGDDDRRRRLIDEIRDLGGKLPELLERETIGSELEGGMLVVDRRNLGLAYKESVENAAGVLLRQTLVTGLEPAPEGWRVVTRLDEDFAARTVVVATGTFLAGEVDDGGAVVGGGRMGEIPARSLARSLEALGIDMVTIKATNMPRLAGDSGSGIEPVDTSEYRLVPDGSQLGEQYLFGPYITGTRQEQLSRVREASGVPGAWMTRASYHVKSLAIAAGQVGTNLEARGHRGLYFTGRAAACCNYTEAAATGVVAGADAAALAAEQPRPMLIENMKFVSLLCRAVAEQERRPVTIRIDGPGC